MSATENIDPVVESEHTEIVTDPTSEDPFQAAEEAALAAETTETEEAPAEMADTPAEENAETVDDDPEAEVAPEVETEPEAVDELGLTPEDHSNPDIQAKLAGMDKYFNQKSQELAAMKREHDALLAEARAKAAEERGAGPKEAKKVQDAPPEPPGEDATTEQWNKFYDERARWNARAEFAPVMEELQGLKAQSQQYEIAMKTQQISAEVASYPGYSDEIEQRMMAIAEADQTGGVYRQIWDSPDFRRMLFDKAKSDLVVESVTSAAQAKDLEKKQRQSRSAANATPRPTSVSRSVGEDPYAGKTFANEQERMEYAERQALEGYSG